MKRLKSIIEYSIAGFFILILFGCEKIFSVMYGCPVVNINRTGQFLIKDSLTENPLPGIKVTYLENNEIDFSDENGLVDYKITINEFSDIHLVLEDVDGEKNGSYSGKIEKTLDDDDSTIDEFKMISD